MKLIYRVNQGIVHLPVSSFPLPKTGRCQAYPNSGHTSSLRSAGQPLASGKALTYSVEKPGWECNKLCWNRTTLCVVTESIVGEKSAELSSMPRTRRLVLLRHAKSSWEDRSLKDHDRPLSKRGRLAAVNVAGKLHQLGWLPELILSSTDKGNLGVPQLPGQGCSFHGFRTNTYKLSFMETPSGIKVNQLELGQVCVVNGCYCLDR